MADLTFETLDALRQNHPAWRLLASDNATLVASFLHKVFLVQRVHGLPRADLVSRLEDVLYVFRAGGRDRFPQTAEAYLDTWAQDGNGWLRKYYPAGSDEPHYDLTPSTEKALTWLESLVQGDFVGTESRLLTVVELLRQLVSGSSEDPQVRLADLERRRAELDREIEAVKAGRQPVLDEVRARDRFQQAAAMARDLLSDFRQVEENFRTLDRKTREQIALWAGTKGELIGTILGQREAIAESDQGRSFRSFWDFLMDPSRQEEVGRLWSAAVALPAIRSLDPDPRLKRIHYDWLGAGDHTQRTIALLSAQLRRFLDDRVWWENRRIAQLLHQIEVGALSIRDDLPAGVFFEIDALAPDIGLPMERPLFAPPFKAELGGTVAPGTGDDVDAGLLFDQVLVDRQRLEAWADQALADHDQVTLGRLVEDHPLDQGLAELVTWLGVASDRPETVFDEVEDQISWTARDQRKRTASGNRVIFTRRKGNHGK